MRDLAYQRRVLATIDAYLTELIRQKRTADRIQELASQNPDLNIPVPDFPAATWNAMRQATWTGPRLPPSRQTIPFSPRQDGIGRTVPNICLKVPTAGGKTYLAVSALSRIFASYLATNYGFVLWIVPNEAIYQQTKRHFSNRDHPYRQTLDRIAAGRVKLLEKDDRLSARDVESHLCVMLLMLQSANRDTRDSLRFFRDRGNVAGFFPDEADGEAHRALLQRIPNLDSYSDDMSLWPVVKDSLGNVMRLVRPVVILDEGHRAISELASRTLYGFNPCFVMELTATPKDRTVGTNTTYANVLVDVLGSELDREGMIKMPINLQVKSGDDWRDCLLASIQQLRTLTEAADSHLAEGRTYIRPIMLIQVERTGDDQRDGVYIHADDARDYLLQAGFDASEIAIKTAQVNDLTSPENLDLLSPTCPVRVIITKQALQEGWDCPFAYVLCSLAASRNLSAMTQLMGRILRQPQATKTGLAALDECYIFCYHTQTGAVVQAIKNSLEAAGMADMVTSLRIADNGSSGGANLAARAIHRRPALHNLQVFLPRVLKVENEITRHLDYEQDIVYYIDWQQVNYDTLIQRIPDNIPVVETQMRRLILTDGGAGEYIQAVDVGHFTETQLFDAPFATRVLSDIVINLYATRAIVGNVLRRLRDRGFTEQRLGSMMGFIIEQMRKWLHEERDRLAEQIFLQQVAAGHIQFRLRVDGANWRMPDHITTTQPKTARKLSKTDGNPLEKSLFTPVYEDDLNQDERQFACYLDDLAALRWWHRNVARSNYGLQGWKKNLVYPDFIFSWTQQDGREKIAVIETKGDQLDNPDTAYKQRLLRLLTENFQTPQRIGNLELEIDADTTIICDLVLMSEWRSRIHTDIIQD